MHFQYLYVSCLRHKFFSISCSSSLENDFCGTGWKLGQKNLKVLIAIINFFTWTSSIQLHSRTYMHINIYIMYILARVCWHHVNKLHEINLYWINKSNLIVTNAQIYFAWGSLKSLPMGFSGLYTLLLQLLL